MSTNVLNAIEYANSLNAITIGITGYDGGELKKISKLGIHVPINDMQISEDFHLIITHIIMKKIKSRLW
jgi:D-sedoheptulose 7-phosphate isomerase